jgi:hypothetical protein
MDVLSPRWGNAPSKLGHVELYSREVISMKSIILEKQVRKNVMKHSPNIRLRTINVILTKKSLCT